MDEIITHVTDVDRRLTQQKLREFVKILDAYSLTPIGDLNTLSREDAIKTRRMARALVAVYDRGGVTGLANFINRVLDYYDTAEQFKMKPYEMEIFDEFLERSHCEIKKFERKLSRRLFCIAPLALAGMAAAGGTVALAGHYKVNQIESEQNKKRAELEKGNSSADTRKLNEEMDELEKLRRRWVIIYSDGVGITTGTSVGAVLAMLINHKLSTAGKELEMLLLELHETICETTRYAKVDPDSFRHY